MDIQKQLEAFYENEGQEDIRLQEGGGQYLEFVTASRCLKRFLPSGSHVLDSCAGTGVYAFHLASQGHRVTAGDIVRYNVDIMCEKQPGSPQLEQIVELDTTDLSRFADASFDAVLCMGALYHQPDESDRRGAVEESLRVLRPGGIFAATYMNRYAVILNNLMGSLSDLDEVMDFLQKGQEGIFYASTPEEILAMLADYPLDMQAHTALDGMATFLRHTSGRLDDTGLERFGVYHEAVCEIPSLLGYSYHNMVIAAKR